MTDPSVTYLRDLISSYSEAIRANDTKSNIVIVFVAAMISALAILHEKFLIPVHLSYFISAFLFVIIIHLISLYPRHPLIGRPSFPLLRTANSQTFTYPDDLTFIIQSLRLRCASLSIVLFWKNLLLRVGLAISILNVILLVAAFAIKGSNT